MHIARGRRAGISGYGTLTIRNSSVVSFKVFGGNVGAEVEGGDTRDPLTLSRGGRRPY